MKKPCAPCKPRPTSKPNTLTNKENPNHDHADSPQPRRANCGAREALEASETAPGHGNEAFQPEATQSADAEETPEVFTPDTAEKVDWVLGKIADHRARANRIRMNADTMAKQAEAEADALEWRFGPALQAFAREQLTGGKRKSLTLFHGTLGFRTVPAGVVVGNEAGALAWAKDNLPGAVVERLDKAALTKALLSTGEAMDFAAFTPEDQRFFIKQASDAGPGEGKAAE